jgi:hypothetical protein
MTRKLCTTVAILSVLFIGNSLPVEASHPVPLVGV